MQLRYVPSKSHRFFYGEVGVSLRGGNAPALDDTPQGDPNDPDGNSWGRRNYEETSYSSGVPALEPGEYTWLIRDFYRDYFDRNAEIKGRGH